MQTYLLSPYISPVPNSDSVWRAASPGWDGLWDTACKRLLAQTFTNASVQDFLAQAFTHACLPPDTAFSCTDFPIQVGQKKLTIGWWAETGLWNFRQENLDLAHQIGHTYVRRARPNPSIEWSIFRRIFTSNMIEAPACPQAIQFNDSNFIISFAYIRFAAINNKVYINCVNNIEAHNALGAFWERKEFLPAMQWRLCNKALCSKKRTISTVWILADPPCGLGFDHLTPGRSNHLKIIGPLLHYMTTICFATASFYPAKTVSFYRAYFV